jgi:hypothetical protein
VSVLLASDAVTLYPPAADADAHGWALPGADPYWSGLGNLQLTFGTSDPQAAAGGGSGPFAPRAVQQGQLFLPPDVQLAEGSAAQVRGEWWVLSQVRLVPDPMAVGAGASCWVCSVSSVRQWTGDDAQVPG